MKIGIIGGSGLDDPQLFESIEEKEIYTPYGAPSANILCGFLKGIEVCILARHGKKHEIPPSKVNYRANIWALKSLGCTHIIATTAVGSLKEEIKRGDFVVLDQFIDFTRHRLITFYDSFKGGPVHVSLADPFSEELRKVAISCCEKLELPYHPKGTVVTIEGPRFSTRAESNIFRSWNADIINMSIAPEATLAREASLEYCAIAMSTDYDCWKRDEEPVTWEEILATFQQNADKMKKLLIKIIEHFGAQILDQVKLSIRTVPHWPKQGIMFRDITSLLQSPEAFNTVIHMLAYRYKNKSIDAIAGIESRGFIFGSALARALKKSFVLIRKVGKLPGETISEEYELEYGSSKIEIHTDAFKEGERVLIIDDLIATGGTALAACNLIKKLKGEVVECSFIIDLPDLHGRDKLKEQGFNTYSLITFEGD